MAKLSTKMVEELNSQMGRELSTANQYLAMAFILMSAASKSWRTFFIHKPKKSAAMR